MLEREEKGFKNKMSYCLYGDFPSDKSILKRNSENKDQMRCSGEFVRICLQGVQFCSSFYLRDFILLALHLLQSVKSW